MGRKIVHRSVSQFFILLIFVIIPIVGSTQTVVTASNEQSGALFGSAVLGIDDTNGNGAGEYLVSAPFEDVGSWTSAGRVYHIDGANQDTIQTFTASDMDFNIFFGTSLSTIEDLSGNGASEIIIGARGATLQSSSTNVGGAYIFDSETAEHLMTVRPPAGEEATRFGLSVSSIEDVNSDGVSDIVVIDQVRIGTSFNYKFVIYLYSGVDSDSDGYADLIRKVDQPTNLEYSFFSDRGEVVAGPDFTGDGSGDLIVGNAINEVAHIVNGGTGEVEYTIGSPNGIGGFNGYFGSSVAIINDVTSDSIPEFVVGAEEEAGDDYSYGGKAYVYNGATLEVMKEIYSPMDSGFPTGFGVAVQSIPDINDDGERDFLIGSQDTSPGGITYAGRVYVYSSSDFSFIDELISPIPQSEGSYYTNFGEVLAGVPDANSDGRAEIVVGAPNDSVQSGLSNMGVAYQYSAQGFPQYNQPPTADFVADTTSLTTADTIHFTANASDPDGNIIAYRWDFMGDGSVDDTTQNPTFSYYSAGRFNATLTVLDDDSISSSASTLIEVQPTEEENVPNQITDNSVDDTNPFIIGPIEVYYHSEMDGGIIRDYTTDYSIQSNADHLNADQKNVLYTANTINGNSGVFLYNGLVTPDLLGKVHYYPSRGGTAPLNDDLGSQGLIAYSYSEGTSDFVLGLHADGQEFTGVGMGRNIMLPRVSAAGYTVAYAAKEMNSGDPYEIYRYTWSDSVNGGTNERIAVAEDQYENLGMENEVTPLGISLSDSGEVIAWEAKTSTSTGTSMHIEYWKNGDVHEVTGQGWPIVSRDGRYVLTHDYLYDTQQQVGLDIGEAETGDMAASTDYRYTFDMDSEANYVVFTGQTNRKLFIHSRLANETQLVHESDYDMRTPRISPDGMYLTWEQKVGGNDWEIFTFENPMSEGGFSSPATNISQLQDQNVDRHQISAEGRYTTFLGYLGSSPEVYLYDNQSGTTRMLTQNAKGESNLRLAGNGSALAWNETDSDGRFEAVYYDVQNQNRFTLADYAYVEALSNSGGEVLVDFSGNATQYRGLYTIYNRATDSFHPLPDYDEPVDYSANLKHILFADDDTLFVQNRQDSSISEIVVSGELEDEDMASIDSTGQRLLYRMESASDNMQKLVLHDIITDTTKIVAEYSLDADADIELFDMSADGNAIFWLVSDAGNVDDHHVLYRYDISADQMVTMDDQRVDEYMDDYDISADGRFFVYTKDVSDESSEQDVYYYDHQSQTVEGITGDQAPDYKPKVSADGSKVIWRGAVGVGPQADYEIWQYQLYEPVGIDDNSKPNVPGRFKLYSNYPNPFNPATTFRFALPENARVNIQVFNIRGQQVESFDVGRMSAGVREIHFDGSDLASGVYLYRVVAKSADQTFRKSGKFTLLK